MHAGLGAAWPVAVPLPVVGCGGTQRGSLPAVLRHCMARPGCADALPVHCGRHAVQRRLVLEGHCARAAWEG